MDKARIRSASNIIGQTPPEDLLRYVLEERNTPDEVKAALIDVASAKYKARARNQGVGSESREDPYELFARKFKFNEDYMKTFLLVAQGLTDRQIAKKLGVPLNTIHDRVKTILAKLEKNSRYAIIATAYQHGFPLQPQT